MKCPRCGGDHADSAATAVRQIAASRAWAAGLLFPHRNNEGELCFLAQVLQIEAPRERLYEAVVDAIYAWCVQAVERAKTGQAQPTDIPEPFREAFGGLYE